MSLEKRCARYTKTEVKVHLLLLASLQMLDLLTEHVIALRVVSDEVGAVTVVCHGCLCK